MKRKILLFLFCIFILFTLTACGNSGKDIKGEWHVVKIGGLSLTDYGKAMDADEILFRTNYTFNEDGTFSAISGLNIAAGENGIQGKWSYSDKKYTLDIPGTSGFSAYLENGILYLSTSAGQMELEPGTDNIDKEAAKNAYDKAFSEPSPGPSPGESPSPEPSASPSASPGAIDESPEPSESPDADTPLDTSEMYNNILKNTWKDADENIYNFYNDHTCYVKYSNGNELSGEYQFLDDDGQIVLDLIINEAEQIYVLEEMEEDSFSFSDGLTLSAVEE